MIVVSFFPIAGKNAHDRGAARLEGEGGAWCRNVLT
jgi:hypothetical protein